MLRIVVYFSINIDSIMLYFMRMFTYTHQVYGLDIIPDLFLQMAGMMLELSRMNFTFRGHIPNLFINHKAIHSNFVLFFTARLI